ncbi:hypothetical protein SDJN03_01052, partial [Cucurbita argyrosperma subsp. sororia]
MNRRTIDTYNENETHGPSTPTVRPSLHAQVPSVRVANNKSCNSIAIATATVLIETASLLPSCPAIREAKVALRKDM